MEALTRLVTESLARHGLDRPVDPRRLQWSRWFRCDSPHSLLVVPSKPGIFALAEEILEFGRTDAPECIAESALARPSGRAPIPQAPESSPEGAAFNSPGRKSGVDPSAGAESRRDGTHSDSPASKRMLAVLQFSEDDDMAFVLDRMFTRPNPMRSRLATGRCFLRFVVIEDQAQRRSICSALNQWLISSAEKASGIGADFASSLELTDRVAADDLVARAPSPANANGSTSVGRTLLSANAAITTSQAQTTSPETKPGAVRTAPHAVAPHLDSGAATNIHCPQPLPSGF